MRERRSTTHPAPGTDQTRELAVPVVQEELAVGRRTVPTGVVRVSRRERRRTEIVDEPVVQSEAVVQRTPVNRYVDEVPEARREGDEIVIPVVEEVLIVQKRLVLREEVRVAVKRKTSRERRPVELRGHEIVVERMPGEEAGSEGVLRDEDAAVNTGRNAPTTRAGRSRPRDRERGAEARRTRR